MADKGLARHGNGEEEPQACGTGVIGSVERLNRHYEHSYQQHGVNQDAHVVAQVKSVDKEQLEPLGNLDEARHEAVEDGSDYDARHAEGD